MRRALGMDSQEIVDEIKQSGLRGRGSAVTGKRESMPECLLATASSLADESSLSLVGFVREGSLVIYTNPQLIANRGGENDRQ